jgi:hypothetical protein
MIDTSEKPPTARGTSETKVKHDEDREKILLVSAAGVVAECQFDGKSVLDYPDPMRVFESYEHYQSDLLKAVTAYGNDFSVKVFLGGVRKAVALLEPFAATIKAVAIDHAERAAIQGSTRLTLAWDEELRNALNV